jgi:hypothetical protein
MRTLNLITNIQIRRYVEASKGASFYQVRDAQMIDINLTDVKVRYSGKTAVLRFDPPMKALREARERLVQMDKDSLHKLGRNDITITRFIPCYTNPIHLFNFTICFTTYTAFCRAGNFQPGSLLFDNLLYTLPRFAKFCVTIQPYLFVIMVGIHAFESVMMIRKLAKHGLTPFESIWWSWVGTCFVEGAPSFWRLDGLIAEKTKEKEAKKH